MTFASKLKELRNDVGLTQQQFIDALYKKTGKKIAISAYRNYESNKKRRIPKSDILIAISNFYEIDTRYLTEDIYDGSSSYKNVCKREYQKGYQDAINDLINYLTKHSIKEANNGFTSRALED